MHASATIRYFFPPIRVLRLVPPVNWQTRLRTAVERSGKKHSAIARDAGVSPATLSRILNRRMSPTFDTVVRIAHAVGENVGWLLDERGFTISGDEQRQLRKVVRFLDDVVIGAALRRDRYDSNAVSAGNTDVPRLFASRGARLAYEASGDSMIGAGIADRDLVFVKPTRSVREAGGRVVVCRFEGSDYIRVLDVRAGRMRLLSRNERYPAIEVSEDRLELIGIVVGRTGALS